SICGQYSEAAERRHISSSTSGNRLVNFFSTTKLFPMTQCASGHGRRPHMQAAGRCGASACLETSPPPQLSLGRACFDPGESPSVSSVVHWPSPRECCPNFDFGFL